MLTLLRWLVAGGLATVVTLALFVAMTHMIDGTAILESLIRVFPLIQIELPPPDEDCSDGPRLDNAVYIEGVLGHYASGTFRPLGDAEIFGLNALGNEQLVEVSETGVFRFVTAFPSQAPSPCPVAEVIPQRLRIRAEGCQERSIPVTPAWIPHRVLLQCPGRE
jgi:hypothetical protein